MGELASKREWFAVKNLLRRQVVGKAELTKDKYEGKTAVQWAEFHGEVDMAQELAFYVSRATSRLFLFLCFLEFLRLLSTARGD